MKKLYTLALMLVAFCSYGQAILLNNLPDLVQCPGTTFDLTEQIPVALGDLDAADYTITFHETYSDGISGNNPITNPENYTPASATISTVIIRVANATTFSYQFFSLIYVDEDTINPLDTYFCNTYIIPEMYYGPGMSLYTEPGGAGTEVLVNATITETTTLYQRLDNGMCSVEKEFTLFKIDESTTIDVGPLTACDDNGDGYASFILEYLYGMVMDEIGYVEFNMNFYPTEQDAADETNQLEWVYTNSIPFNEVIYANLTLYPGECSIIFPVTLEVLNCNSEFSTVTGTVTYDADGNGCDANDGPAQNILVYYQQNNYTYYTYTNTSGVYNFSMIPDGNITISTIADSSNPLSYTYTMPDNISGADFCLNQIEFGTDVEVIIYPVWNAVPGFTTHYGVLYKNNGSTTASGDITITFDDTLMAFNSSNTPATVNGNTVVLSYSNLQPFQQQYSSLSFTLATPPALQSGDILTFTADITTLAEDENPADNTFTLNQTVVNSFDPNDITVFEGEYITPEQTDKYLHYRVRFQNTGDFQATNVRVALDLDENLDWNTFEPLNASHSYQANRADDGTVEFVFDNINLTYESDDEEASQGYVLYRVKPKSTVGVGDSMSAQASIYFDFNEAIITNTATTTVQSVNGLQDNLKNKFTLYPNPANGLVSINVNQFDNNSGITVTNMLGKVVVEQQLQSAQQSIDVSFLSEGVYFVTITTNLGKATQKLIIQ